jgi:hypothetical protein
MRWMVTLKHMLGSLGWVCQGKMNLLTAGGDQAEVVLQFPSATPIPSVINLLLHKTISFHSPRR